MFHDTYASLKKEKSASGKKYFFMSDFLLTFAATNMTAFNPHMTLHKLFLNIKKRDVYFNY